MATEVDIKLLWGRAASRCSICRRELTQDKTAVTASFVLGEQAHIVGEKEDGPRGNSNLSIEERNHYHNLILLCPTHHTEIDKNTQDFTVERLHMIKTGHELWVQDQLATSSDTAKQAHGLIYAHLIDSAVTRCRLGSFASWASWALAAEPSWDADFPDEIYDFRRQVIGAVWPGTLVELERSIQTLSIALHVAAQTFLEHSEKEADGRLHAYAFYKANGWNEHYHEDLERYKTWRQKCWDLVESVGKAANWLGDVVRRDVNPLFFATEGRFIVTHGPDMSFAYRTDLFVFTDEEKAQQPSLLCEHLRKDGA